MNEYNLKVDGRLTGEARRKALRAELDRKIKDAEAQDAARARLKTVYQDVSKLLGIPISNTTELVKLLLPHTSPKFRAGIQKDWDVPLPFAGQKKVKRTRKSNNVKKSELTSTEVALIKKAKKLSSVNPLPAGTKNAGKNLPYPTFAALKGIKLRK